MSLVGLLLTIALFGLIVVLITTLIPMPETFRRVIWMIAGVILLIYILQSLGLVGHIGDVRIK